MPADQTQTSKIRIDVAIATSGRRDLLSDVLEHITQQIRMPDECLICPASPDDVDFDRLDKINMPIRVVQGPRGLPAQRNALLRASNADVLVYLDDDFLMANDFLDELEKIILSNSDIVVATGSVLADGILTAGIDIIEGKRILDNAGVNRAEGIANTYNAYGCNMVVRTAVARANAIFFDERLPLYAWLEDVDFGRRMAPYGRIVRASRLRGVHLGTKLSGRSPGRRLGYSQVVNPMYLAKKGTMGWKRALSQIGRNVMANFIRSFRPEPWVDRRGRLYGNLVGFLDICRWRWSPERALEV